MEQSSLAQINSRLTANAKQDQVTMNLKLPPSQMAHTKNNTIYSDILWCGCCQATELLECLSPFVDVLTAVVVPKVLTWLKALSTVDQDIICQNPEGLLGHK